MTGTIGLCLRDRGPLKNDVNIRPASVSNFRDTTRAASERILTTHVGSLARPPNLVEFLKLIEAGQACDKAAYEACLKESIEEVVRQQVEAGVDIVSDGEFSKGRNWAFYIHDRISGISTRDATPEEMRDPMASAGGGQDMRAFPEFYAEYNRATGLAARLGKRFVVSSA